MHASSLYNGDMFPVFWGYFELSNTNFGDIFTWMVDSVELLPKRDRKP